jgi:hypothetical protein
MLRDVSLEGNRAHFVELAFGGAHSALSLWGNGIVAGF